MYFSILNFIKQIFVEITWKEELISMSYQIDMVMGSPHILIFSYFLVVEIVQFQQLKNHQIFVIYYQF